MVREGLTEMVARSVEASNADRTSYNDTVRVSKRDFGIMPKEG